MNSGDNGERRRRPLRGPLRWLGEEGLRAEMARGTLAAFAIRVSGMGLAFAVQILIARTLGLSAFGEYAYVLSWLLVLSLVTSLGLDTAALRLVASYRTQESWGLLRGFLQSSQLLAAGSASLAALGAAGVVWLIRADLTPSLAATAWVGCGVLPLLVSLNLKSATLRAFKRIVPAQFTVELLRPAALGALVVALYLTGAERLDAPTTMTATLAAVVTSLLVAGIALNRALPILVREAAPVRSPREWIGIALPLAFLSGLYIVLDQTDIIMVGALLDTDRAGVYTAAARLAQLVPLGLIAANTIAAPLIAELWAAGRRQRLQQLLTRTARWVSLATLPLVVALCLGGRFALGLFGPGFEQAYIPLLVLIAGQVVNVAAGSVGYVMTMTGLEKAAAVTTAGVVAANLVLNAVLIPRLGILGAAVATATSTIGWNLVMLAIIRRRRDLDSSCLPTRLDAQ